MLKIAFTTTDFPTTSIERKHFTINVTTFIAYRGENRKNARKEARALRDLNLKKKTATTTNLRSQHLNDQTIQKETNQSPNKATNESHETTRIKNSNSPLHFKTLSEDKIHFNLLYKLEIENTKTFNKVQISKKLDKQF